MVNMATEHEKFTIPLIDFSKFLNGSPEERKKAADEILHGFRKAGFIYLQNLPISQSERQAVFNASADYFQLPLDTKLTHAMPSVDSNRGYSATGQEKLGNESPDMKETMHFGREDPKYPNIWPDPEHGLSEFKDRVTRFYDFCAQMSVEIMRAIAVGLSIDEYYFDDFMSFGDHKLRLLHYPQVSKSVFQSNAGQVRAGAHTDYGAITLLFQDSRGGLQVQTPEGSYINATPVDNAIIVNAGDLLARWSNDAIKSTVHRVVEPPSSDEDSTYPARYSIAFFANPHETTLIEAIPGTFAVESDKKYESIKSGEYYLQRLEATY